MNIDFFTLMHKSLHKRPDYLDHIEPYYALVHPPYLAVNPNMPNTIDDYFCFCYMITMGKTNLDTY